MATLTTKSSDVNLAERNSKAPVSPRPQQNKIPDRNATDINRKAISEQNFSTHIIEDDSDISEIRNAANSSHGFSNKNTASRTPQNNERTQNATQQNIFAANKGPPSDSDINLKYNTQKQLQEMANTLEDTARKSSGHIKPNLSIAAPEFSQLNAHSHYNNNANMLNNFYAGDQNQNQMLYLLCLLNNGGTMPQQPQAPGYYHSLSQLGYQPMYNEFQQLNMMSNTTPTHKNQMYPQELGLYAQGIPEGYYNGGQYGLPIHQGGPSALESLIKQTQRMQEDSDKVAKPQETYNQLDANIINEKEMAKAAAAAKKATSEQQNQLTLPNKNVQTISETNSVSEDTIDREASKGVPNSGPNSALIARRKKQRTCFNRYCQTDSTNPALWSKNKVNGSTICKLCEDGWKKGQFCHFCQQIYVDNDVYCADDRSWIECDQCQRWTHLECEDKNIQRQYELAKNRGDDNFSYSCPICRAKTQNNTRKPARRNLNVSSGTSAYALRKLDRTPNDEEDEDKEEDPLTKHRKLNSDVDVEDQRYIELNAQTGARINPLPTSEEPGVAQKKLDNLFQKQMQRKRLQVVKPSAFVDTFGAIDNLLGQQGKRLMLNENEVKNDLQLMRNGNGGKGGNFNPIIEKGSPEEDEEVSDEKLSVVQEEPKANARAGDRRVGNGRSTRNKEKPSARSSANTRNKNIAGNEEAEGDFVVTGLPKRQTRSRRKME